MLSHFIEREKEAIQEKQNEFEQFWKDGDAEALANQFTEDAIYNPSRGKPDVVGRDGKLPSFSNYTHRDLQCNQGAHYILYNYL